LATSGVLENVRDGIHEKSAPVDTTHGFDCQLIVTVAKFVFVFDITSSATIAREDV
jgi:hypothetical protein